MQGKLWLANVALRDILKFEPSSLERSDQKKSRRRERRHSQTSDFHRKVTLNPDSDTLFCGEYGDAPPMCIRMLLWNSMASGLFEVMHTMPIVSRCTCRSIRVRSHWKSQDPRAKVVTTLFQCHPNVGTRIALERARAADMPSWEVTQRSYGEVTGKFQNSRGRYHTPEISSSGSGSE